MSVVFPASGCEMIANVRRRAISGGNAGRLVWRVSGMGGRIALRVEQGKGVAALS